MSRRSERAREIWATVHAERRALASDLERLEPGQWGTPSLCDGWTVHDVLAHLVASAKTTRLGFMTGLVRARFDFDRENAAGIARERGATPADTLAGFRSVLDRTDTPPAPLETRLVEAVVHGEDIRRPLGLAGTYPLDAVDQALRHQVRTSTSFGGAREHLAGLRLAPTDTDATIGSGLPVQGSALALLLAISGRDVAFTDLEGPGVADLVRRLRP